MYLPTPRRIPDYCLPLLSRVLATCFCSTFVVVPSIAALAGPYAFLIVVFKELIFFPGAGIGAQLEATILNFIGALWALGYGNTARALSSAAAARYGPDCILSRVIVALAMVLHSFLAGYTFSKLPRLRLAARMAGFIAIWVLTVHVGDSRTSYKSFTNLGFCTLSAAGLSLIASLPLLYRTESPFAKRIVALLGSVSELLRRVTEQMLDRFSMPNHDELESLRAELFGQAQALSDAYTAATFETRLGRVDAHFLEGFVVSVERLRIQVSVGLPEFAGLIPPDGTLQEFLDAVEQPSQALVEEIVSALQLCQQVVSIAYDLDKHLNASLVLPEDCLSSRSSLLQASNALRGETKRAIANLLCKARATPEDSAVTEDVYDRDLSGLCLYLASILEVASETWIMLRQAEDILKINLLASRRLQVPRLSWAWLGMAPTTALISSSDPVMHDSDDGAPRDGEMRAIMKETPKVNPRRPTRLFRWWPSPSTFIRLRLRLSAVLRAIQRSPHARYGFKAALGTLLLTLPSYLPKGSAARSWFHNNHGQWMAIAYLFVLETDTGATMRNGMWRIVGTTCGATFAYLSWLMCHSNPYGLAALVTFFQIPAGYVILRTSAPGAGVVASVTLPVIVFTPYQALQSTNVLSLAMLRASWITVGIVSALAVHYLVFPLHARLAFMKQIGKAVNLTTQSYIALNRPFLESGTIPRDYRAIGQTAEANVKHRLRSAEGLINDMTLEFTLLPKPVTLYREITSTVRRMIDLISTLRKIRQYVPSSETVSKVLDRRISLVSSILLALYTCEHAFTSQAPLPQLLPSAQSALENLITGLNGQLLEKDEGAQQPSEMAYMFSLAESEAMAELSETLDILLRLTYTLFGVTDWLDGASHDSNIRRPLPNSSSHAWKDVTDWTDHSGVRPIALLIEKHGSRKSSSSTDPPCYTPFPSQPVKSPSAFV